MANKSWNVPSQFDIIKGYPPAGDNRQYRLSKAATFTCYRCDQQTTSELVATQHGMWDRLLCAACYSSSVPDARVRDRIQSPLSPEVNVCGKTSTRHTGVVTQTFRRWFGFGRKVHGGGWGLGRKRREAEGTKQKTVESERNSSSETSTACYRSRNTHATQRGGETNAR